MEVREQLESAVGLEIEPCPFCGLSARATSVARLARFEGIEVRTWLQVCCRCGASGPARPTLREAADAWNAALRDQPDERVAI
jgi:Lar family restriction alleviation protein